MLTQILKFFCGKSMLMLAISGIVVTVVSIIAAIVTQEWFVVAPLSVAFIVALAVIPIAREELATDAHNAQVEKERVEKQLAKSRNQ